MQYRGLESGADCRTKVLYTFRNVLLVTLKKYNWIKENHTVWAAVDEQEDIFTTTALILSQIAEITIHIRKGSTMEQVVNELADIISLACRQIERYDVSVEDAMQNRIEKRYKGQVEAIIKKYNGLIK